MSGAAEPGAADGRRVVLVDHHDSYTWNLAHLVASVTGSLPAVLQHDEVDATTVLGYDYVILSPGPGHPDDPHDFDVGREVLRRAAVPVLGVCLGMQGMVTAFGGLVEAATPAHGELTAVVHDGRGLFRGVPTPMLAVRYHSLVATVVPTDLVVTARTEDGIVMGVRHRSRPLEGVQFHPESVLSEHGRAMMTNFLATEASP